MRHRDPFPFFKAFSSAGAPGVLIGSGFSAILVSAVGIFNEDAAGTFHLL